MSETKINLKKKKKSSRESILVNKTFEANEKIYHQEVLFGGDILWIRDVVVPIANICTPNPAKVAMKLKLSDIFKSAVH